MARNKKETKNIYNKYIKKEDVNYMELIAIQKWKITVKNKEEEFGSH